MVWSFGCGLRGVFFGCSYAELCLTRLFHSGVIPRAAEALFEKLGSGVPNARDSRSGLRAPARYSTPISQLKPHAEKGWTMKASYVEVCFSLVLVWQLNDSDWSRYIMNNYETYYCRKEPDRRKGFQLPFEKTPRGEYS